MLLRTGFQIHERLARVQCAVPAIVKSSSVKMIGSRFRDHIHNRAGSASIFCIGRIAGDAEFFYHLVGKLVRCAIAAPCLREKSIIVVDAIHQIAGLEPANAAER